MKHKKIIIVKKKNMKTSLKTGFAQIFSCCPPKWGVLAWPWPVRPPSLTKLKIGGLKVKSLI